VSATCGRTEVLVDYADMKHLFRCDREAQHFGHHHGVTTDGTEHWWMTPPDPDPLTVDEEPWIYNDIEPDFKPGACGPLILVMALACWAVVIAAVLLLRRLLQ
jgi:hypothetical protein